MPMTPGFGRLRNPAHLLDKLRDDFRRINDDPTNEYAAVDFFVTAESLIDWVLPGRANKKAREQMRVSNVLLEVTSHIASGAKHYLAEWQHHKSVNDVQRPTGAFSWRTFSGAEFQTSELRVILDGRAAVQLGARVVRIRPLAAMVLAHWESRLSASAPQPGTPSHP